MENLLLTDAAGVSFDITWLREYGSGKISGDIALPVDTDLVAHIGHAAGRVNVHVDPSEGAVAVLAAAFAGVHHLQWLAEMRETSSAGLPEWLEEVAGASADAPEFVAALARHAKAALGMLPPDEGAELDGWTRRRIAELCGADDGPCVRERLSILTGLAERACSQVGAAVERKVAAGLCRPRSGRVRIEFALPFIDRRGRDSMWRMLARTEVRAEIDGRLTAVPPGRTEAAGRQDLYRSTLAFSTGLRTGARVYDPDGFRIGWTGRRRLGREAACHAAETLQAAYELGREPARWLESLPADAVVDETLSLSVPGRLAQAWIETPAEDDAPYFPAFSALSVAVQETMRRWLPLVYFEDEERYADPSLAIPLVVYQSTLPFVCPSATHFTYDFMEDDPPALWRTSTRARLKREIARIERRMAAAGMREAAAMYRQDQASWVLARVNRYSHRYRSLYAADAFLVDELITLAARARAFRTSRRKPEKAVALMARHAERFVRRVEARLRRVYPGVDLSGLGALLFVEATAALGAAAGGAGSLRAVLHLAAAGAERTFLSGEPSSDRGTLELSLAG